MKLAEHEILENTSEFCSEKRVISPLPEIGDKMAAAWLSLYAN